MTPEEHRLAWKESIFPQQCWICGFNPWLRPELLQVHHIERKGHSTVKQDHTSNYFMTCNRCHATRLNTIGNMSHAMQLAYKLKYDPEHFDLDAWLGLRDHDLKAPDRVTLREVEDALDWLENH